MHPIPGSLRIPARSPSVAALLWMRQPSRRARKRHQRRLSRNSSRAPPRNLSARKSRGYSPPNLLRRRKIRGRRKGHPIGRRTGMQIPLRIGLRTGLGGGPSPRRLVRTPDVRPRSRRRATHPVATGISILRALDETPAAGAVERRSDSRRLERRRPVAGLPDRRSA